ncbi:MULTISPECIES: GntR family transcriptional regulator [Kaistia]|uniref:GntR family transcriptional regulator n=1 Tax=Kaistia nematophila TaxID=2994654 RepID=A0A9X3E2E3_9HYPH|nr:GntR family transcriptional regulator [Kaistia nematophila]MCX5569888.1 GntR family transcriptional regulator [Kaistia nematophila]
MNFSKTQHAYEMIRRQILDGVFRPGDPLRLTHIARELNLSEMPVREALRLLQKDGLVIMNLHRSAEVARLSFRTAWEIEEVRLHLEITACVMAVPEHDAESIRQLRALIEELEKDLDHPVTVARRNRAFHTAVMARTPNAFLREHVEELWDRAWQSSSASFFDLMPERKRLLPVENRRMVDLIEARDSAGLERLLVDRLSAIKVAWARALMSARASEERV